MLSLDLAAELDEDWYHSDDPIKSGISFYVKVCSHMLLDPLLQVPAHFEL